MRFLFTGILILKQELHLNSCVQPAFSMMERWHLNRQMKANASSYGMDRSRVKLFYIRLRIGYLPTL